MCVMCVARELCVRKCMHVPQPISIERVYLCNFARWSTAAMFTIRTETVVTAPSGNVWVVDGVVEIEGALYAPISKRSQGSIAFKRFLRSAKWYHRAGDLIAELTSLRKKALKKALQDKDPFADEGDGDAAPSEACSYWKERREFLKVVTSAHTVGVEKLLNVELPSFELRNGTVVPAVTTRMPDPADYLTDKTFRGILLELNQDTLSWVTDRYTTLPRGEDTTLQRGEACVRPDKYRKRNYTPSKHKDRKQSDAELGFDTLGNEPDTGETANSIGFETHEDERAVARDACIDKSESEENFRTPQKAAANEIEAVATCTPRKVWPIFMMKS